MIKRTEVANRLLVIFINCMTDFCKRYDTLSNASKNSIHYIYKQLGLESILNSKLEIYKQKQSSGTQSNKFANDSGHPVESDINPSVQIDITQNNTKPNPSKSSFYNSYITQQRGSNGVYRLASVLQTKILAGNLEKKIWANPEPLREEHKNCPSLKKTQNPISLDLNNHIISKYKTETDANRELIKKNPGRSKGTMKQTPNPNLNKPKPNLLNKFKNLLTAPFRWVRDSFR